MTTTAANIQALPSGEFAAVADATLDIYIARATARVSADWSDTIRDTAILYLAAHLYALDAQGTGAASGAVSSESAGSVSRSYAVSATSTGYGATHWGRVFEQLLREQHFGPVVI